MKRIRLTAACLLIAVSACSSHGTGVVPSTNPTANGPVSSAGAQAKLSIVVPQHTATKSASRRAPQYVSPSSANLTVAVNGGAPSTYGLTPQSPGCAVQGVNLLCTFSIPAPVGTDSFSLDLTDGAGNALSRNVVSATIAPGVSTPLSVTLAGVVSSVAILPGRNSTLEGNAQPYHFPGLFPQPIEVEALDADGNIIIGPGAPSVTNVAVTSGSTFASVGTANSTDQNAFLLSPVDGTAGGQTVTVTATSQGTALADGTTSQPVSGSATFTFTPAMMIASGRSVNAYSIETGALVKQFNICVGLCVLTFATAATTDAKGNIYVVYASLLGLSRTSTLAVYPPGATVASYTLGSAQGVHSTSGITVDSSGNIYVANGTGFRQPRPSIQIFAPGATSAKYTITGAASGISTPGGIAVDASGNIYLANQTGNITEYAPNTQTPLQTISDPSLAVPDWLALSPSGGLYVADAQNFDIAYFAPGQTAVTNTLTDPSFSGNNTQLLLDPNGNLWASLPNAASIERLDASALPNAVSIGATIYGAAGAMGWIP